MKLLPDLTQMTSRRNSNYLASVYIGVIGGTFNLPIALWNGAFGPFLKRLWEVLSAYIQFVFLGLIGKADILTDKEVELRMAKEMTQKALIKAGVEIATKLADDMHLMDK